MLGAYISLPVESDKIRELLHVLPDDSYTLRLVSCHAGISLQYYSDMIDDWRDIRLLSNIEYLHVKMHFTF